MIVIAGSLMPYVPDPALRDPLSQPTFALLFDEEDTALSFMWPGGLGRGNSGLNKGALLRFEPRHV